MVYFIYEWLNNIVNTVKNVEIYLCSELQLSKFHLDSEVLLLAYKKFIKMK